MAFTHPSTAAHRQAAARSRAALPTTIAVILAAYAAMLVTIWLTNHLDAVTLSAGLLLMLAEVVVVAALSNMTVAIVFAVSAVLLANWNLVPPTHTLVIGSTEDLILLAVFVLSATLASATVALVDRRTRQAATATAEAEGLRETLDLPAGESDPADILATLAARYDLTCVELLDGDGSVVREWRGEPSSGPPRLQVSLAEDHLLRAWGPETIGSDPSALHALALSALRSHQARVLRLEAERAHELADADRARSALLAAVGHDLRTPLSTISLAAETLRTSEAGLTQSDRTALLDTIADSTTRLDELVANLLDMSRLEAGKLLVAPCEVNIADVVAEAALGLPDEVIAVRVANDVQAWADPGLLRQVLSNLFFNAVRHGGGHAVCEVVSVPGRVHVRVVDHGPGIPAGLRESVFEPFASTRRGDGGQGLGLAIARGFSEAMGGGLRVEATPGGGTTMVVELRTGP